MRARLALGAYALAVTSLNACGGESKRHESTIAAGGHGGSGARGGSGALGGTTARGGAGATCPTEGPTSPYSPDCPGNLPREGCTYSYAGCRAPLTLTLRCNERGLWSLDTASCVTGDFCTRPGAGQLHCINEVWNLAQGGEQATCPEVRPTWGDTCATGNINYPPCGYACADGTWTLAVCNTALQRWQHDPGCPEDVLDAGAPSPMGAGGEPSK